MSGTTVTMTGLVSVPNLAAGDNSTDAANTAYVYTATSSSTSITTTGGSITLTAQQYGVPILLISGALTSNATVVMPNTGVWTVVNTTSGAFTVTVKTSAGTGVTVDQGRTCEVIANGTNVVYATSSGTVTPNMDGSASAGTASSVARADHVHPTDTSRAPVASPAFTGTPTASTAAQNTNSTQLATTAFVLGQASSTTPYASGTAAVGASTTYARADHVHPSDSTTTSYNIGRNKLDNSLFIYWQRGTSFAAGGYTADRWVLNYLNSTTSVNRFSLTSTDTGQIGDEEAIYAFQAAVTGTSGAGDYSLIVQRIEAVRRLSGKTVTVSFYAKATSGTPKIGVSLDQWGGTGGTSVLGTGQAVTLSTTWARYSLTFTLGSMTGLTIGTSGDDYTSCIFWLSSGSNYSTRSGGISVQSGTFQLWGIQLEIGSSTTQLEKLPWQTEVARCQRFYRTGAGTVYFNAQVAGDWTTTSVYFETTMRTTPTVSITSTTTDNTTGMSAAYNTTSSSFSAYVSSLVAGACLWNFTYTASADL